MSERHSDHAARIDDLEIRLAHCDSTIADLNEIVTAQWRKIDALERQLANLRDEFQNLGAPRDAQEPPPPHY